MLLCDLTVEPGEVFLELGALTQEFGEALGHVELVWRRMAEVWSCFCLARPLERSREKESGCRSQEQKGGKVGGFGSWWLVMCFIALQRIKSASGELRPYAIKSAMVGRELASSPLRLKKD